MGLALRVNAFRDVEAADVYGALAAFYAKRGAALVAEADRERRFDVHHRRGRWCVVEWDAGWEWKLRREAQLHVSRQLGVPGLLVFVYDGEYWGYELFDRGVARDHFVQSSEDAPRWFPGDDCGGDAAVLAGTLGLAEADVAPYLVRWRDWVERPAVDRLARPGDTFKRGDECAVVDLLRALEVDVGVRDRRVQFGGAIWRSFRPSFGA